MATTVMIDGQLVPSEQARVSVFDRGFLYGDSIFESLRSYGGEPFALGEHLARLQQSAERVLIQLPVPLAVLEAEIRRAISVHPGAEHYVRLTLTRGVGQVLGLDPELALAPLRVVLVSDFIPPPPELYAQGIAAITYRVERPSDVAGVSEAKLGNYLVAVLASRAARAAGAREALLEDASGNVLEAATANLFAVFQGKLRTAPESSAILPGITRARVLALAAGAGLGIELAPLPKAELALADEVFVTSSLRELVPVVNIDGHPVGDGMPGPVTRELLRSYRRAAAGA